MSYPALVEDYLKYVDYKNNFKQTGIIDLSETAFVYPTTLLPLGELVHNNQGQYVPPTSPNVASYVEIIINPNSLNSSHTYTPIVELPANSEDADEPLNKIFAMQRGPAEFGGESAFKYLVSELVDNIYQHSNFTRASFMGQRYDKLGFIDLSFYDNGVTIPRTFQEKGL